MAESDIPKTRCLLTRDGKTAHYDCDTVFRDGVPYLVLEWVNDAPFVTVELEPEHFHPLQGWGDVKYMYEFAVSVP